MSSPLTLTPERIRELTTDPRCPWCSKAVLPGQPTTLLGGQDVHRRCAAEYDALLARDTQPLSPTR